MKAALSAILAAAALPTAALAEQTVTVIAPLEGAARVAPRDGGAAIELANAYWRAGRTAEANNAYRRALALDNVMMETRFGDSIWSHEVARRQLATVSVATR